jgi:hypothetical protein
VERGVNTGFRGVESPNPVLVPFRALHVDMMSCKKRDGKNADKRGNDVNDHQDKTPLTVF